MLWELRAEVSSVPSATALIRPSDLRTARLGHSEGLKVQARVIVALLGDDLWAS